MERVGELSGATGLHALQVRKGQLGEPEMWRFRRRQGDITGRGGAREGGRGRKGGRA